MNYCRIPDFLTKFSQNKTAPTEEIQREIDIFNTFDEPHMYWSEFVRTHRLYTHLIKMSVIYLIKNIIHADKRVVLNECDAYFSQEIIELESQCSSEAALGITKKVYTDSREVQADLTALRSKR